MNANNSNQRSRGRGSSNRNNQQRGGRNNHQHSSGNNGGGRGRGGGNQPRNPNQIKQMLDKYMSQARDMIQSGDRVAAEGLMQHAEHYQRLYNELSAAKPQDNKSNNRQNQKPELRDGKKGGVKPEVKTKGENVAIKEEKPNVKTDGKEEKSKPAVKVDVKPEAAVKEEKVKSKPKANAEDKAEDKEEKPKPKRRPRVSKTVAAE